MPTRPVHGLEWFAPPVRGSQTAVGRVGVTLLLSTLALLTACGGGGTAEPPPATAAAPAVSGRIYPAVQGIVLGEYGRDGQLLQTSSTSLQDGSFTFMRPLTGVRLSAREPAPAGIVHPVYAGQLGSQPGSRVEITALTTWFDQLVTHGLTPAAAREQLAATARGACTVKGQVPDLSHVSADDTDTSAQHDWLLSAMAAYLAGARSVGVGPLVDYQGWLGVLGRQTGVLGDLCSHAATVSSAEWRASVAEALRAPGSTQQPNAARLSQALAEARAQGLASMARRIQVLEYPGETTLLATQRQAAPGRALSLSQDLAVALYRQLSALPAQDTGSTQPLADRPHPLLAADGSMGFRISATFDPTSSPDATLQLLNQGDRPRTLQLAINEQPLGDLPEVLAEIVALPVEFTGEPLYRKAWRYVIAHAQRSVPLAGGMFLHQPDLWLRSVGTSYCDAQATVLYWIWTAMGYEARVVGLTGHVTAEIRVDGHWQILDPYLQVTYLDRAGRPAGVAELEQDPTLITQPEHPTRAPDDVAYSQVIADVFATTEDNFIQDRYMAPLLQPFDSRWVLPAGARLDFPAGLTLTRPSTEPGFTVDVASVRLWLPPGFSGTLPLPLLLVDAHGDAQLTLLGQPVNPARDAVGALLDDLYLRQFSGTGITELQVDRVGAGGLLLTLMLSPQYAKEGSPLTVEATGEDLSSLVFSLGQTSETSH